MVSRYVRQNILGFIAIFIALGGLAVAAALPKNSVKSKQIKNGQVKSVDVANNGLTGVDINEQTLSGVPIAGNAVNSATVADDSLTGADIDEAALDEVMFAGVNADGTLARSNVGATSSGSGGSYDVDFNRDITSCSWIAGIGSPGFPGNEPPGTIEATGSEEGPDTLFVNTTDLTGADGARAFHVWVTC